VRWDARALYGYLREGWHPQHGDAQGPMTVVITGLQSLPDADVDAIALYVASLGTRGERREAVRTNTPDLAVNQNDGAGIFAAACADCHDGSRSLPFAGIPLALSSATTDGSAANLVNVMLDGLHPAEGAAGPIMPGFATAMSDAQLESLAAFVRARIAAKPPWADIAARLRDTRIRNHD
jgi:mono/diheme cytochrome c family protein